MRNKVYVTITRAKCLNQIFLKGRRRRPADDVFNILKKKSNNVVHLKIDEAMESRRSYKEVRNR